MTEERTTLRDWHRLFGLLLTDFFTDSPFIVEVERDLSMQQQLLDVVIVRRGPGEYAGRLPDGLEGLLQHNLVTFKSHHEALDPWAMKELIGHYVAYRKLVSVSPSDLLPEEQFGLYAVCARFPQNLSGKTRWHKVQDGVYDCLWGTDTVRVVVAGDLPRETHNAPLHLFSASPELLGFGSSVYRRRSELTSTLLEQLFQAARREGYAMAYTLEDFKRDYIRNNFLRMTPEEREELIRALPLSERLAGAKSEDLLAALQPEERLAGLQPEERLAGLSAEQIRKYLDHLTAGRKAARKPRRKK